MSSASTTSAEGLSPGEVYQDYQAIQPSNHPLSFYEINLSTLSGAITNDQTSLNSYTPSLGAGLMVADTMLQALKQFGIVNQSLFALPQYSFRLPNGNSVDLWGSVVDMGVTDLRRPQYLALQLANQALSSDAMMLQTTHTGDDPTWNVSSLTNTVQFTGAHDLQSYAFQQGSSFSLIVFNLSRSSTLPVTFSGANAPTGTVQMQQLTSANVSDTNESSNVVQIATSTLTTPGGLSLPPYSMTVLNWSTSATAPAISAVRASAITQTSATINWTTDEPSTSQVQGSGFTTVSSSTLVTNHSLTLTGLTAGTAYNFTVTSVNSGSLSANSSSSFTTQLAAPVISGVSISAVTPTSATISWNTDQAANSEVTYGSTAAYGQVAANSTTFGTTHSITITGLTSNTTYHYLITSANSQARRQAQPMQPSRH